MTSLIEFGQFNLTFTQSQPFCLLSCEDIFSEKSYLALLNGFKELNWKEERTDFYHQFSSVITKSTNTPFQLLFDPSFFLFFKSKLEILLGTNLRSVCRIVAHKLVSSQEIGIHNDYCDPNLGYENYRFIFQFSNFEGKISGGELSFLYSQDKEDVIKKYPYSRNVGICFEISPLSFHFVAPVKEDRYTLVMYLWKEKSKYDGSGTDIF